MSKWYRVDIGSEEYDNITISKLCLLTKYKSRTKVKFYWTNKKTTMSGSTSSLKTVLNTSLLDGRYKYMVCIKFKDETDAMAFKLEWL